ncbi:MAG: rRNA maturation RNase YbeY [Chitinophagaceae bacterium]|nr:rRNA maturation RNase YbeY [Chitinophagaceae bacterium]
MPSKSKVCFFFEYKKFSLKDRSRLKTFINSLFLKEGQKLLSLNYVFCSDKKLLEINRQFLRHDYFTDIISFDLSGDIGIEGEIYISIDRVRDNAKKLDIPFKLELHRVIFHGALHLCGYKDKSKSEQRKMRDKEDLYLTSYLN